LFAGGAAGASSAAPFTDPNAVGSIGLCNQAGQQITSGNVTTTPFAWRAVSTQPALAPYNNAGRTATLVAYQPMQALPPGDWSGAQMTASSRYTNPANPMAAATARDQSLEDIIEQYPPRWDGYLQLRIYLGTVNEPAYTLHYPALDIQVTGNTWHAVGGSPVDCSSGTAESIESILLPTSTAPSPSTTSPTPSHSTTSHSTTSPTTTSPATATASGGGKTLSGGATPGTGAQEPRSTGASGGKAAVSAAPAVADAAGTSDVPLFLGVAFAVLLVLAASVSVVLRRRRPAAPQPRTGSTPASPASSSTTKGDSP
jgi:hypothetical protein